MLRHGSSGIIEVKNAGRKTNVENNCYNRYLAFSSNFGLVGGWRTRDNVDYWGCGGNYLHLALGLKLLFYFSKIVI